MISNGSVFRNNGILGESINSDCLADCISDNYDAIILASSWDPRCLNVTSLDLLKFSFGVVFIFDDRDDFGYRDNNDAELLEWSNVHISELNIINGKSTEVLVAFDGLFELIARKSVEKGRPLNILFDLSTCPRFISLSTLSKGVALGIIKKIDFIYGECMYPEPNVGVQGDEEVMFTGGSWQTEPLAHCLGEFNPGLKSCITVSIGFEGNKTLRVLNDEDPDFLKLLLPSPGFTDGYKERALRANSEIVETLARSGVENIEARAGDAIEAWKKLDNANYDFGVKHLNRSYLCAGSKPHSLGMTLSAMSDCTTSVLYSLPEEHNFVNVTAVQNYWLFQITSLTVPTSIR